MALLEVVKLQTQRHNLIKCKGIQANHKACHDEKTEQNCFISTTMPLFFIMETKAGNQNARLFHPRWVPMDTGKEKSAVFLVEIINRLSE